MNRLTKSPTLATPTSISQTKRKLLAKACRTSVLRGSGKVPISGIIEYTTEVSVGILILDKRFSGKFVSS